MNSTPATVIHVGPDPRACGGVARAVGMYAAMSSHGYRVEIIPSVGADGSLLRWLQWPLGLVRFGVLATIRRPAIAHIHVASRGSFMRKQSFAAIAHAFRIPYVAHVHGGGFAEFAASGGARRSKKVRRLLRGAAAVVALSESWRGIIGTLCDRDDIYVLPNPVTIPCEPTAGIERPSIVFAGHLVRHKGVDILAEALTLLSAREISCEVTIAGRGDMASAFVAVRPPVRVELAGWLSPDDLSAVMARSSIFVLPSRVEGVPLALLEAMSHGMACVASAVGGVPDVIVDADRGLLVDSEDPVGLADALERLLADRQLRVDLGVAARTYVRGVHSLPIVRKRLYAMYSSLGFVPSEELGT